MTTVPEPPSMGGCAAMMAAVIVGAGVWILVLWEIGVIR